MARKPFKAVPLRVVANAPPAAAPRKEDGHSLFSPIMIMLPLAVFTAVFAWDWPSRDAGPTDLPAVTVAVTGEAPRPRGWDTSPAELDAAQPDLAQLTPARAPAPAGFAQGQDRERARFGLCNGRGRAGGNCVIDGDTFWYAGEKIRVADINAPEVGSPGCPREAALGAQATTRFLALLNAGPFTLAANADGTGRERDKYGRALRIVTRGGRSLGGTLVAEGLAEEWRGYRRDWC
ncbi:thermonuclease family protein [Croceibacterium aestuarii]|uniref:thermonuclease family protein n=1 Tax=Croceibacterium aestuarii TaxID=3064139 RepID=UPI00272E85E4|nr:thermonuclease family protein [Croceibacterium sp. D39]